MSSVVVRAHATDSVTLVVIAGDIDLASAPELRERLLNVPSRNVVLDLSGVQWLTAAGLTVLLELRNRLQAAGAGVVLAAAPASARRLVTTAGLDAALPISSTVGEATRMLIPVPPRGRMTTGTARTVGSCRHEVRTYHAPPGPAE
ncbi:STAS domain-containing protein [Pseudonocardia sp. H11422]|uniref:STAS domain-containing protein n=1 Tax=Pseudonocardia sp. H11422 TaxID=2835866 RepID=UPI001BDC1DE7|nr:STAS domain-containing protein [Pseudonocardia sp. H11422]